MPFKGWHSRGYLPHFDSPEAIQFVTYRLADSLPTEALEKIALSDRPESLRDELLDRGAGACWLDAPTSLTSSNSPCSCSMAIGIGFTHGPSCPITCTSCLP